MHREPVSLPTTKRPQGRFVVRENRHARIRDLGGMAGGASSHATIAAHRAALSGSENSPSRVSRNPGTRFFYIPQPSTEPSLSLCRSESSSRTPVRFDCAPPCVAAHASGRIRGRLGTPP